MLILHNEYILKLIRKVEITWKVSVINVFTQSLHEKCPNTELFLVCIFPNSDVFSPNARKYRPEKTPYLDTFHAVIGKKSMFKEVNVLWMHCFGNRKEYFLFERMLPFTAKGNIFSAHNRCSLLLVQYFWVCVNRTWDSQTDTLTISCHPAKCKPQILIAHFYSRLYEIHLRLYQILNPCKMWRNLAIHPYEYFPAYNQKYSSWKYTCLVYLQMTQGIKNFKKLYLTMGQHQF